MDELTKKFRESATQRCPPALAAFFRGDLFVRESYVRYYDDIVESLAWDDIRGVTVTGNPGIGKTVFMAYFLLRYQLERPHTTFVLISYNNESEFQRAVEWRDGQIIREVADVTGIERKYRNDETAIFLLDGPPHGVPVLLHRFVVFTRPDKKWLRKVDHEYDQKKLFLPLWSIGELQAAVEALDLARMMGRMDDVPAFPRCKDLRYADEVVYRFVVFGGLARPCLETDAVLLESQLKKLQEDADTVDVTTGKMPVHDDDGEDDQRVSSRLYHCYPTSPLVTYSLKIASAYVAFLLAVRVNRLTGEDKERFDFMAKACVEVSVLHRVMVKHQLFTVLQQGSQVVANSLGHSADSPDTDLRLTIPPSNPARKPASRQVGQQCSTIEPLHFPGPMVFESIDAMYLSKDFSEAFFGLRDEELSDCGLVDVNAPWGRIIQAVAVHIDALDNHGVDGIGLCGLVEHLRRLGVTPSRVALVFVVPTDQADSFVRQHIPGSSRTNNRFPATALNDITSEMAKTLESANVHTIGDLREYPGDRILDEEQDLVFAQAQNLLHQHEDNAVATGSATHGMLQDVLQCPSPRLHCRAGGAGLEPPSQLVDNSQLQVPHALPSPHQQQRSNASRGQFGCCCCR